MVRSATFCLLLGLSCMAQTQTQTVQAKWTMDAAAVNAGFRVEMRREAEAICAVLIPPTSVVPVETGGVLTQTLDAAPYRGSTIRLTALVRAEPGGSGQLRIRVNRPRQQSGLFDNLTDQPVRLPEWTKSEVTVTVNADAESIETGLLSAGTAPVWIKEISILVVQSAPRQVSARTEPQNLRFTTKTDEWTTLPAAYKVEAVKKGCHSGSPCALLTAPAVRVAGFGSVLQTFNAEAWRGRTVRLRASLRLQATRPADLARLWLRTEQAGEVLSEDNLLEHLDYRVVRSSEWTPVEIVRNIDANARELSIGIMIEGSGKVLIDDMAFSIVKDPEALPRPNADVSLLVRPLRSPLAVEDMPGAPLLRVDQLPNAPVLSAELPAPDWPSLPRPSIEDQGRSINLAARFAVAYVRSLPNFLCNMAIHRAQDVKGGGWKPTDLLDVQLGFVDGKERYKLVGINGRPSSRQYEHVGGAISEGDFAGIMAETFHPHSAEFHWDHWAKLRDRNVQVYRYEVKQEKSSYELRASDEKGREVRIITAHHGYVYIDPESHIVMRIEQIADPAANFAIRSASTTLDYDWNQVGGQKVLLPVRSEISMGTTNLRSRNIIDFRDYRKFTADTQIRFEEEPAPPATESKP